MYTMITDPPTEGQFVTIWEYDGIIWSDTFRYTNAGLEVYNPNEDEWSEGVTESDLLDPQKGRVKFIVTGED